MSDASRGQLLLRGPESAWGEIPGANAVTTRMRFTGESLGNRKSTVLSEEIRSDRQRTDMPLVGIDAQGDVNMEMIHGEPFDTLLQATLCGTWSTNAAITDGATTDTSPTVTSASAAFSAKDLHKPISGTGIPASSFIGVINSATSIGLSSSATANVPANATATATGLTLTITGRSSYLRNGVVNRSFGLEVGFLDVAQYLYFDGMIPSRFSLDVAARQIIKNTTSWMGRKGAFSSSSVAGSTTPTEPSTSAPMKAGSDISILSAGTSNTEMTGVVCRRISLEIANSLRPRELATQEYGAEPGRNVMEITGTVETYFDNVARYNAFIANGKFAAKFRFTSSDIVGLSNTYDITLPTLKISDAPVEVPGNEADIYQNFQFRALLDPAVAYSVHVDRGLVVVAA